MPTVPPDYSNSDPYFGMLGHPILPAGLNFDGINESEQNSPGVNWPIWPMFRTYWEPLTPIVITEDAIEVFDGCADFAVPAEPNEMTFGAEDNLIQLGGRWPDVVPPAMSNTVVFPREDRELDIREPSPTTAVPGSAARLQLARDARVHQARRPT